MRGISNCAKGEFSQCEIKTANTFTQNKTFIDFAVAHDVDYIAHSFVQIG
jgi:pyruvate kinase